MSGDSPARIAHRADARPDLSRAERLLDEQYRLLRLVALGRPLREILESLVGFLERESRSFIASVMLVDDTSTTLRLAAAPRLPAFVADAIDGLPIGPESGACGTTAFTGKSVTIADVRTDPRAAPWLEISRRAGILAVTSSPIFDSRGAVIGTFALYFADARGPAAAELELIELARDLASVAIERDREQRALAKLQAELEHRVAERTAELESFTYSVSHDLRAPLRAIDGRLAILAEDLGAALPAELQSHLEAARRAACNMSDLIDDLLSLSRCGRKPLRPVSVAVAPLVRDAWDELAPARHGPTIEIEIGLLPDCVADRGLIGHVWSNLLSNAVKYTLPREIAHVRVGGAAGEDEVVYSVSDDGIGFDQAYAAEIFGVFQRLHAQDAYEGTGVGLALVKRIVERHGGRAWGNGIPGGGATFSFALPLVPR